MSAQWVEGVKTPSLLPPVFGSGRRMCHLTKPRFVADWRLLRFVLLVSSTSCGEYLSQGPRKGRTGASNLVPYPRLNLAEDDPLWRRETPKVDVDKQKRCLQVLLRI